MILVIIQEINYHFVAIYCNFIYLKNVIFHSFFINPIDVLNFPLFYNRMACHQELDFKSKCLELNKLCFCKL